MVFGALLLIVFGGNAVFWVAALGLVAIVDGLVLSGWAAVDPVGLLLLEVAPE